jgi:23S rRNA (cytosine1962-C5)-methyltransferase
VNGTDKKLKIDYNELIQANVERIKPYLDSNNISAYRLFSSSFINPLSVDIYQDNAVIQVFEKTEIEVMTRLELDLKNQLRIKSFFYKNRTKDEFTLPVSSPKKIVVEEYGHKFIVNLSDYLDTGLFLDHRETRHWLASLCHDKIVLNTFAYTGSFTIYAAAAGASKTYSVDISRVYCEWVKENLVLNNLPLENNWVSKMDTLEFFQYALKKKLTFDIIIIDPPTFSKNKGQSFSVQKDYPILINGALELLRPTGFILFSTNYREFMMRQKDLQSCIIKENRDSFPLDYAGTQPHRCFIITK